MFAMLATLEQVLEGLIVFLVFTALYGCLRLVKKFEYGALFVPFTHFAAGIIFIGLSRAFLYLWSLGIYQLSDFSFELWEQILFYLGLISFIWAGIRLRQISLKPSSSAYVSQDAYIMVGLFLIAIIVVGIAQAIEPKLAPILMDSVLENLGILHLLALVLGGVAAFFIYEARIGWGKYLPVGAYPILGFILLMGIHHSWEFLSHYGILHLPNATFALTKQLIAVCAFVLLTVGLMRIGIVLPQQSTPQAKPQIKV